MFSPDFHENAVKEASIVRARHADARFKPYRDIALHILKTEEDVDAPTLARRILSSQKAGGYYSQLTLVRKLRNDWEIRGLLKIRKRGENSPLPGETSGRSL